MKSCHNSHKDSLISHFAQPTHSVYFEYTSGLFLFQDIPNCCMCPIQIKMNKKGCLENALHALKENEQAQSPQECWGDLFKLHTSVYSPFYTASSRRLHSANTLTVRYKR